MAEQQITNLDSIVGKTIERVTIWCDERLGLRFSDGTFITIEAVEPDSGCGFLRVSTEQSIPMLVGLGYISHEEGLQREVEEARSRAEAFRLQNEAQERGHYARLKAKYG